MLGNKGLRGTTPERSCEHLVLGSGVEGAGEGGGEGWKTHYYVTLNRLSFLGPRRP